MHLKALFVVWVLSACNSAAPGIPDQGSPDDLTGPPQVIPPPMPGDCSKLGAVGVWEQITPPQMSLDPAFQTPAGMNYGTGSYVLDPVHLGTVYFGTSAQGIYKTTDCGSSWTHINTGTSGDCYRNQMKENCLDGGRQWAMQIDPTDPQILYTNSGYGYLNGLWKSTNGGVDFKQMLPPCISQAFETAGGFLARISMSPTDHNHLLVTPHFKCVSVPKSATCEATTHSESCIFESKDAGETWSVLENAPSATEGAGLSMVTDSIWLWQTPSGVWRTGDGGASWSQVYAGGTTDAYYKASTGALFVGGSPLITSRDNGQTWTSIAGAPSPSALTGDGTKLFSSFSYCTGKSSKAYQPYTVSTEATPTAWSALASPPMFVGGREIAYDPAHHLLYSGNCLEGFWRVVTQ